MEAEAAVNKHTQSIWSGEMWRGGGGFNFPSSAGGAQMINRLA